MPINLSRGTGLALCLSQLAITIAAIIHFPSVKTEFYTVHPAIINGTLDTHTDTHTSIHTLTTATVALSTPLLICSCIAAVFSTTTAGLVERGILQQDNHYTYETLNDAGMWDLLFWMHCSLAHCILVAIVMSPADIYALTLSNILFTYFLACICQPRQNQPSMTQTNINLLGLWAGLLITFYNLPDAHTGRLTALCIMCLLDYMLGVGHTWDPMPTMDTITNCRLFWVCSASFCLAGLYGAWHDHLLIEEPQQL
jgi:hypothetical protein